MAGPDLSVVTAMVDFSTVVEAVLLVAVAVVYVYVVWKGAKMLIAAVRGGNGYQLDSEGFDPYEHYSYSEYSRDNRAAGLPVLSQAEFDRLK